MGIRIAAQAVKAASTGSNPSTLKPGVITHAGMYTYHLGGGSRRTRNYRSSLSMSWLSDKQTMLSHHTSAGFSRSHRLEASSFYLLQVAGVLSLRGRSEGVQCAAPEERWHAHPALWLQMLKLTPTTLGIQLSPAVYYHNMAVLSHLKLGCLPEVGCQPGRL